MSSGVLSFAICSCFLVRGVMSGGGSGCRRFAVVAPDTKQIIAFFCSSF